MSEPVYVDCETTGLDPLHHEIWEVAAIKGDEEHVWQLPVDLGHAEPMALRIGRFHERRWDFSRLTSPTTFVNEFAKLTDGCHLVGAVVSFNEERLRRLMRRNHYCPTWHYHIVDVEALAVGYLAGVSETSLGPGVHPGSTLPWDSKELTRALGIDLDQFDAHTALGDARWAKAIYEKICGVAS